MKDSYPQGVYFHFDNPHLNYFRSNRGWCTISETLISRLVDVTRDISKHQNRSTAHGHFIELLFQRPKMSFGPSTDSLMSSYFADVPL